MHAGPRLPTIAPLTGLRAFAALWVVLYHFRADLYTLLPTLKKVRWLFDSGYSGVDVFFILSGFIIAYTYLGAFRQVRPGTYGRFLWLRFARIWPVHLVTLLAFYYLILAGGFHRFPLESWDALLNKEFFQQLFMFHAWGRGPNIAWNYPAWSISCEWLAYILFPFAALFLSRVEGRRASLMGIGASFLLSVGVFAAVESSDGSYIWSRIFGEFGAGAFLFILWRGGSFRALPWKVITPTAALASIALAGAIDTQHAIAPVLVSPLFMVLIYGLAIQSDSLSWFLSRRPLVFAGEASYALYMTHAFTQRFIWERLPVADYVHQSAPIRAITVLTWFVLLAFIAVSLHIIVERPARDGMRWLVDRRRAAERPRAAAPDLPHPQIGIP